VIVPVHNAAEFLEQTLRSLRGQTDPPLEIVAVDDASTDESGAIIARLAAEPGPPIRVIRNATAEGVARARNRGVLAATGEWIGLCDNDDLWHPRLLELAMRLQSKHPESKAVGVDSLGFALATERSSLEAHQRGGMVTNWVEGADVVAELTPTVGHLENPPTRVATLADFQQDTVFSTTQLVVERSEYLIAGGCAPWCHRADDWVLCGVLAARGSVPIVNLPLIFYRIRSGSQSHALAESHLPLLMANLALRFGGPTPDVRASAPLYRHLVTNQARASGATGRALGLALLGGGFSLREYIGILKAGRRSTR